MVRSIASGIQSNISRFIHNPDRKRWSMLIVGVFLLVTLISGTYLNLQMRQIAAIQRAESGFILRPIGQAQREVLRLMTLVASYDEAVTADALELQEQLVDSRLTILERQHVNSIVAPDAS